MSNHSELDMAAFKEFTEFKQYLQFKKLKDTQDNKENYNQSNSRVPDDDFNPPLNIKTKLARQDEKTSIRRGRRGGVKERMRQIKKEEFRIKLLKQSGIKSTKLNETDGEQSWTVNQPETNLRRMIECDSKVNCQEEEYPDWLVDHYQPALDEQVAANDLSTQTESKIVDPASL